MVEWILLAKLAGSALAGAAAGAAVAAFWDDIKAWASRAVGYIVDAINWAVEVASDAITYLVKRFSGYFVKTEVYTKNIYSGKYSVKSEEKEVEPSRVPDDMKAQVDQRHDKKLALMQSSI